MSAPATSSALPPLPPHIEKLTGPLIIGELLGMYLFGVLTVQFYLYHLNFPKDPRWIKLLVLTVFILDLASTVMCMADSWHWFAKGYGSIILLSDIWLSAFDTPMIGAFVAAIVQCFYSYRMWTLNKYMLPISILVGMIAVAQVVAGLYGAIVGHIAKTFVAAAPKVRAATWVVNIGAAVADVLIMISMSILLLRSRSKEHKRTDYIVRKIINLTVETNLLSSTLALLTVILLVGIPNTNYFTAPSIVLGRIYSNSLLLILNNRKYLTFSDTIISSTGGGGGSGSKTDSTGRTLTGFRAATRKTVESSYTGYSGRRRDDDLDEVDLDISFRPRGNESLELSTMGTVPSHGVKRDDDMLV